MELTVELRLGYLGIAIRYGLDGSAISDFIQHVRCGESSLGRQLLLQGCSWLLGCTLVVLYTEMGIKIMFFGRTETVPWDRRKTRTEELHLFYSLSSISWGDQMRYVWGRGKVHAGFLWGNLEERERLLGRATRRWEDVIKMGLQEMGGLRLN